MNSMHNSFSGPGGYSGAYPGYVPPPPSALPYYNGYPGDINQSANPYYGKPGSSSVPPGYSSGMAAYNSSMYYQQYGLGYQYGYGKYSLGSGLGYSSEIPSGPSIHPPPPIGTLQAPTTDLGLTGSMFSKSNKFNTNQTPPTPHSSGITLNHGANSAMISPVATPNTPSPGPHVISSSLKGAGATPSPPVDSTEGKKDLDKMKRCQVCGQVFRLMSECLAHMKAVHEAPLSVYSLQHTAGGHVTQPFSSASGLPPHSLSGGLGPPTSRHASIGTPDSPLMALERMGWGEKQNIMPSMQSSSPLASPYTPVSTLSTNSQHLQSGQLSHQTTNLVSQPQASAQVFHSHQHNISGSHQSILLQSSIHQSPSTLQSPVRHPSPVRHASPAPQIINVSQHSGMTSLQNNPSVSDSGIANTVSSHSSVLPVSITLTSHTTRNPSPATQNTSDDLPCITVKHRKTNSYSVSSIIGEISKDSSNRKLEKAPVDEPLALSTKEIKDTEKIVDNNKSPVSEVKEQINDIKSTVDDNENCGSNDTVNSEIFVNETQPKAEALRSQELESDNTMIFKEQEKIEEKFVPEISSESMQPLLPESEKEVSDATSSHADEEVEEPKDSYDSQINDLICNEKLEPDDKSLDDENASPDIKDDLNVRDLSKESEVQELKEVAANKESDENTSAPHSPQTYPETDRSVSLENSHQILSEQSQSSPRPQLTPHSSQSSIPTSQPSPAPHQASGHMQQHSQPPQQQSAQHQHSSSPVGMFHNQSNIKQPPYTGWPMPVAPGYSNQYPYPCPQGSNAPTNLQQLPPNAISGGNMCPKSHGYPMHSRFPSQYHQPNVSSGAPFPHDHHARGPGPHNFMQGHPQGNWYSANPRGPDPKGMWASWPNQTGQPYPQGFYGYPGPNPPQGQKIHHPQQPPPAHVHPSQVTHMHNVQHPHMTQQQQQHPLPQPQPQPQPQMSKGSPVSQQHLQQTQLQQGNAQQNSQQQRHSSTSTVSPVHDVQKDVIQNKHTLQSSPATQKEGCERTCSTPQASDQPNSESSDSHVDKIVKPVMVPTSASDVGDKSLEATGQVQSVTVVNSTGTGVKKMGHKIGPKSKTLAARQYRQLEDLDNYKCTITIQENGSVNGYTSHSSGSSTGGHQSCDSSDSEMTNDDTPTFTLLKPAKRKHYNTGKNGVFIGPKRIKLAKQVRERQEQRHRHMQEQIRQSELEEQLLAQRAEMFTEHSGPLANILLQSSILLSDNKVEESNLVDECIASIKAGKTGGTACSDDDKSGYSLSNGSNSANKKPGRKSQSKVFHNENSVIIKDLVPSLPMRKLRAKDFKWSHYIKSMRYWCNDCGQGFKNQREASMHTEERCKCNCLYMLECYVVVKDIQTHHEYGPKVSLITDFVVLVLEVRNKNEKFFYFYFQIINLFSLFTINHSGLMF